MATPSIEKAKSMKTQEHRNYYCEECWRGYGNCSICPINEKSENYITLNQSPIEQEGK